MKQKNHQQKGFTAALLVVSMMIATTAGTYIMYQAQHGKAGILSAYVNSVKFSNSNLYNMSKKHPAQFQAVLAKCQTAAGIESMGEGGVSACRNAHYVNVQLLGHYS